MANITASQKAILQQISEALAEETIEVQRVRIENANRLSEAKAAARTRTNALVAEAHLVHGLPKSKIGSLGLGTTDRGAVYRRIQEVGEVELEQVAQKDSTASIGIRAKLVDDNIVVQLVRFIHDDLGTDLTGQFTFDAAGDLVDSAVADPHTQEVVEGNPLFAFRLWELPTVQSVAP